MSAEKITLRPVQDSDEEFLLTVYASTRADELKLVPWSQDQKDAFVRMQFAAQKQHYATEYPEASHDIIYRGEVPVGRLYLVRRAEFHILDITVLPQHRNSGTGSFLLRQLMEEARQAAKPVTIYVESFNPSLGLFRQLAFLPVEQKDLHWLMRWSPSA
jgi:ribosomal protein S18 acetylase RimI-like enzyme